MVVLSSIMERRLCVLHRLLAKSVRCNATSFSTSSVIQGKDGNKSSISIGDVTKPVQSARNPDLVPSKYLPQNDQDIPAETLQHLKWIMQKDLLGQDVFLIGRPGPLRRQVAMQYLQLTQREIEYVALSRDTTESDLKQRREIIDGTAHYIDQSAVRAASQGRVLVIDGIEKAERNVLPVLNNLLENREMHLEDGRLLIPASRYDKLLAEYGKDELNKWQLVRVSEDFRVVALGLPVPQYTGNPLDPPLRSRFQARNIKHIPFSQQIKVLQSIGDNLPDETISQLLSFAHTMTTEESHTLGLLDFPLENMPALIALLNKAPNVPLYDAINRLYPYKAFLPKEGIHSVEDTLQTFQLQNQHSLLSKVNLPMELSSAKSKVQIQVGNEAHHINVPVGNHYSHDEGVALNNSSHYVETTYHESLLAELLLSHAVHDFCVIGPRGCGKSVLIERLAQILGYEIEPVMMYQDMTARDLLQQRTTLTNGDTIWRYSPLVIAALEGKMAVLDGIHRVHKGTLAVLHRLVHERELQLYDGTRLLGRERYEEARQACGNISHEEMKDKRKILPIADNFRVVALAEPPNLGGNTSKSQQWFSAEILSMFLFHQMRAPSQCEELHILKSLTGGDPPKSLDSMLQLAHRLRTSDDSSLANIANSLSTRQLVRIARRQNQFPDNDDNVRQIVYKAIMHSFLPALPREAVNKEMEQIGIKDDIKANKFLGNLKCVVENDALTIGTTTVPLFKPDNKTKIPETLFYDTNQNLATMEGMLQDYLLGEHLLLIGNQGVGKNKLVDRMLKLLNRPREYIQLHRDTTIASLTVQPTVHSGIIVYEDSALVKAVKAGHVLVVDEADKAPTHVTCILKNLVESGEMILSDGRRIVPSTSPLLASASTNDKYIAMHPEFRMFVLANRPGFPFLGNDFFASLGDLFSCHSIDNPSMDSEMSMLKQYGQDVPEDTLRRLVIAFSELRQKADEGIIQYPYSTREVVNIVKHLQRFPGEGLGQVVRNVFDFDAYDKEARQSVEEVLQKHGIPINVSTNKISMAREFPLPERRLIGTWEMVRSIGKSKRMIKLPFEEEAVTFDDPEQVTVHKGTIDRVEARGLGFSEMQSYWSLPFHDFAIVGDVVTIKDKHNRQLYDTIHVATSNPVWLYTMKPLSAELSRITLNPFFDNASRGGNGTWRANTLPRIKMSPLAGRFGSVLAVHDEVSNNLVLVEPQSGKVISLRSGSAGSGWLNPVRDLVTKKIGAGTRSNTSSPYFRMLTDFAADNKLLMYTPKGNVIQLLNLAGDIPINYKVELPMTISSVHPLSEDQYLVMADHLESADANDEQHQRLFVLRKEANDEPIPTVLNPVSQSPITYRKELVEEINQLSKEGLTDFGLALVMNEKIQSPNILFNSANSYATLAMGFPELEFSANEVFSWPREEQVKSKDNNPPRAPAYGAKQSADPGRNTVILKDSCQIVTPVSSNDVSQSVKDRNYGLSSPGNIQSYLEVVDLMASKLRYIPVPEPAQQSIYASWYKQTYPDQVLALAPTSNEGLVSVDNAGTVRLWETGVANLERSLTEWRRMVGDSSDPRDLMIQRDGVGDLDTPKHGKIDPTGNPHVGGNTWAGGTGGRDTAGLGGVGGPYRLDAGHDVHQVSDEAKAQVPEHIRKAAREMNRKAYSERLREIQMSEFDANLYDQYASQVRKQVQALRNIISGLQAKAKDRQWLKNQTQGELDDTRLIEGITGEKTIYKRRGEQDPEPGSVQEKPKRLRLLVDVSGSMYRFNGHDQRLERMMESTLMVMEALEGYEDKIKYDIIGHSGEENDLLFTSTRAPPANEKERLDVLKNMLAHSQFCMSGDHTLSATVLAIQELALKAEEYDEAFVIVLSDANFDRYGISPTNFAKILTKKSDVVNAYAIFIGSLGDQADRLAKRLPAGKAFVCLDTRKIPEVLKTIFTSTMLK